MHTLSNEKVLFRSCPYTNYIVLMAVIRQSTDDDVITLGENNLDIKRCVNEVIIHIQFIASIYILTLSMSTYLSLNHTYYVFT